MANYLRQKVKRGGGRDGGGRHQDVPRAIRVAPAVEPSPAAWTGVKWPPMVSDDHQKDLFSVRHETGTGCDGVDHRPAWRCGVAELIMKGWRHHVVSETGTLATIRLTSPDGSMQEERTVLRGMLPRANYPAAVVGRGGREILRLKRPT